MKPGKVELLFLIIARIPLQATASLAVNNKKYSYAFLETAPPKSPLMIAHLHILKCER